jgi:ribosomal protein L11 methyltransferase
VVKPYNIAFRPNAEDIVIDIFPGISFGSGAHPTTRLSVQGIEYALREKQLIKNFSGSTVLDIGTGSGILAIAALKLGIETGIGVDTDACARAEAVKNTDINGYVHKIRIMDKSEIIDSVFSLVTANLRLPDIMMLYPFITQTSNTNGIIVISGLRPFETDTVSKCYTQRYFTCLWRKEEKGWAGLVFAKL